MARKMRQVTADFQRWENPGDKIEGTFHGTEEVPTEIGQMTVGNIITDDGVPVRFVMGEGLQRDFNQINVGDFVSVEFLERVKTTKGMNFNRFNVFVADGE